jgi:hypothetical protein
MKAYCASGDVTGAASKTVVALISSATRRPKLLQVIIGCSGTPADNVAKVAIRKFTADGTGTSGTTFQADSSDGAPSVTTKVNYTVEPTYTSGNVEEISLNQRATVIWNAPLGAEPSVPIGTSNGIGVQLISAPTLAYNVTMVWDE